MKLQFNISLFLCTIFISSCGSLYSPPGPEFDTVTIPYRVISLLSPSDTVSHSGTYGMYSYWQGLAANHDEPTGYSGFIYFSDSSYHSKSIGFDPYDAQSVYDIPVHIERSFTPYFLSEDKSIRDIKIFSDKITFGTLDPDNWYHQQLIIVAKHNLW
mgnify:CR=1 FL=1|jgi:hypothetical protein